MAKSTTRTPDDDDDENIADADWLMNDPSKAKAKPRPSSSSPSPSGSKRPVAGAANQSYDVLGGDDDPGASSASVPPIPVAPRPAADAPRRPKRPPIDEPEAEFDAPPGAEDDDPESAVEEVWTRGAEWTSPLIVVAIAALVVAVLIYYTLTQMMFLASFLLLFVGGAAVLALAYPIFITLERPVRITAEQGVKDYYAMLNYPLPYYKRMWLLLSTAGKSSPEFSSFDDFRDYWKETLASLQGGKAPFLNPLKFKVEEFRSEKSNGSTSVTAKFTIRVYRGEAGPSDEVASFLVRSGLVKGPDRMWYLSNGTLPPSKS
jgi:hypothetical protein